jgi:hypothetical protein
VHNYSKITILPLDPEVPKPGNSEGRTQNRRNKLTTKKVLDLREI